MNKKPLFLLIGKSGSGKTTIAEFLKHRGMKSADSYTTRPPRYEGETGHTFITEKEYDQLENIVAYTIYNSYKYCTTKEQIDAADVYVIDVDGLYTLLRNYKEDRPFIVLYLNCSSFIRFLRMVKRGDSYKKAYERIKNDSKNWFLNLYEHRKNKAKTEPMFYIEIVNANKKIKFVTKQIVKIISSYNYE